MLLSTLTQSLATAILLISTLVSAYRPIQFCKHRGENGQAEMCFAVNTFYNQTTDTTDLYITLKTWRFKASKKGWAALGLGKRMIGALMFIAYGDPEEGTMTTTVRSATGHHPPLSVTDKSVYTGEIPDIEIRRSDFTAYEGEYFNEMLQLKPTHEGTSEIICYNCQLWSGFTIRNESNAQEMIWATNSWQDWQGDYGVDRNIEMHKFGLGFGFLWVDFLNAHISTEKPFFPSIDELKGNLGMHEYYVPDPPTEDELAEGKKLEEVAAGAEGSAEDDEHLDLDLHVPATETQTAAPTAPTEAISNPTSSKPDEGVVDQQEDTTPSDEEPPIYPAPTLMGKSIRDWLWNLHGLLMTLSFLVLYPLGAHLIRSGRATAFNLHWTTQSLATLSVLIGAGIGFWQSHGISVAHQFIGLAVVAALLAQVALGWHHHRLYLRLKRKTGFSRAHVLLGRTVMGAGLVNLVMGLLLAQYGRGPVASLVVAEILLVMCLVYSLGRDRVRHLSGVVDPEGTRQPLGDEAEEYFQLAGDDDEDDGGMESGDEGATRKQEERRDQAKRLAKLDKV